MSEARIGRVLVASLHQAIADLLPTRLEFYENWLNVAGLREGTIGLAPLTAVLSFLRTEGHAYGLITARAGEYAAAWTFESVPAVRAPGRPRAAAGSARTRGARAPRARWSARRIRARARSPDEEGRRHASICAARSSAKCARRRSSRCAGSMRRRSRGCCSSSTCRPTRGSTSAAPSAGRRGCVAVGHRSGRADRQTRSPHDRWRWLAIAAALTQQLPARASPAPGRLWRRRGFSSCPFETPPRDGRTLLARRSRGRAHRRRSQCARARRDSRGGAGACLRPAPSAAESPS